MNIRHLFSICICVFLPATAFAETMLANVYPIENVREIVVSGGASLELRQGNSETLRAEATQEDLEYVSVDLSGTRLTLKMKSKRKGFFDWFGSDYGKVKFIVQIKDLSKLELSGAAHGEIGNLRANNLTLNLYGASRANIGQLRVADLTVDISGAGRVKVNEIHAQQVDANISGAAQMELEGAGEVNDLRLDVSGASKYFGRELASVNARARASGASHIEVRVSETLDANASGASHISYYGNPRVKQDSSGASRISAKED